MQAKNKWLVVVGITTISALGAYSCMQHLAPALTQAKQRRQLKQFVKKRLNGNLTALKLIDRLSDDEIANLTKSVESIQLLKDKVSLQSGQLPEKMAALKESLIAYAKQLN